TGSAVQLDCMRLSAASLEGVPQWGFHGPNHPTGCGAGASKPAMEALSRSRDGEPHHRPARLPEAWFDAEQGGAVPMFHLRARRPRLEAYFLRSAVLGWLYSRGAVSGPKRRPSRDNQPSTERMVGPASVAMEVAARSNHIGRGSEHSRRAGPMVLRAGACSRF